MQYSGGTYKLLWISTCINSNQQITYHLVQRTLDISAEARSIIPDDEGKILLVLSIVCEFTSNEATLKT